MLIVILIMLLFLLLLLLLLFNIRQNSEAVSENKLREKYIALPMLKKS